MRRNWSPTVTSVDVIKRILTQGALVNRKDESDGSSVLHQAAEAGSRLFVWFLLKRGADVNARDGFGRTALHLACESHHGSSQRVTELLLKNGAEINSQTNSGETALHVACWVKDRELVDVLLKKRADVNLTDQNGMTPLHVVAHSRGNESDMASSLLQSSANVNAVDSIGRSPLHWACFFEGMMTVFQILNKGGNLNLRDFRGDTPLHLACMTKRKEVVDMLICKGAKINSTNHRGRTALHLAALHGAASIVDILLDNGADVCAEDDAGDTPLHLAITWVSKNVCFNRDNLTDVVEKLLNRGAEIDVRNSSQKTPFDDMVDFEEEFCSRYFENTSYKDKLRNLTEIFIQHVIKLQTAKLPVRVDIRKKLGSIKYVIIQTSCFQELQRLKTIKVVEGFSLHHVFSDFKNPAFLSYEKNFDDYLSSSHLIKYFPIYGHLLRTTFQKAKMQTRKIQSNEKEANDYMNGKPCDINVFKEYNDGVLRKKL